MSQYDYEHQLEMLQLSDEAMEAIAGGGNATIINSDVDINNSIVAVDIIQNGSNNFLSIANNWRRH